MTPHRDEIDLSTELRGLRPEPRPEFTAELDGRATAGFPRRSRLRALAERLRATPPRRALLPVGAAAAAIIVVGTVVIANTGGGSSEVSSGGNMLSLPAPTGEGAARSAAGAESPLPAGSAPSVGLDSAAGAATQTSKRRIERSADLDIGVPPDEVANAASQALETVHANNGVVLHSSLEQGSERQQVAIFELLIPSGRLGDALAAFSALGEVLSRKERTADITAPTVGAAERLQDSRARIDSLLGQLAAAETEAEREAVEVELRAERRRAAHLRTRLAALKRKANLSRVSLRIGSEFYGSAIGGSWSVGDAISDAGRVLAVAASIAIVALAVLVPLALLALLTWLARRAWLRRRRERALD